MSVVDSPRALLQSSDVSVLRDDEATLHKLMMRNNSRSSGRKFLHDPAWPNAQSLLLSPGYATPGVYQEVSLCSEILLCRLQSLLDQFLQLADAGRLLLGGGGAEGETGAAVGAGGRSGQPLPEELQHAALLAALQALQSPTITQRHHQIQTINQSTVGSAGRSD